MCSQLPNCVCDAEDPRPSLADIGMEPLYSRRKLEREHAALRDALEGLIVAVEAEVNEKGGGGFILARLADARAAIANTTPSALSSPHRHTEGLS